MRNELQAIAQHVEQTSRIGYLFGKGAVVAKVNEQLNQLEAEFAKQSENLTALEKQKAKAEQKLTEQTNALESTKRKLKKKSEELDDLEEELDDTQTNLRKIKTELEKSQQTQKILTRDYQQLDQAHQHLQTDFHQEKITTALRENLVGAVISAKNDNPHLASFQQLLHNEFLAFAAEESSLQNEAGALLKLQEIEKELMMIGGFPEFHSARTVAVGGGFSAGKSEFISSFFTDKALKLPSSIEPTTAIPTYVVNGLKENNCLIGMNTQGGTVNLLNIDPELTQKLNHQFMQSFRFPLKSIMPYMFLTTTLAYEHICFVDTPGYNPSGSHTAQDMDVAKEFVENAEALIWLVGADVNGTIPRTDIDFLKSVLSAHKKPIYFVLNKADVKSPSDVEAILDEFGHVLETEKISYVGISAYDAIYGEELSFRQMRLPDFLASMNKSSNKQNKILHKLYEVEEAYQFAIKQDIKQRKAVANTLDDIAWDLNAENFKKGEGRIYDQLEIVAAYFNTKAQENHLMQLTKLMNRFTKIINNLFGKKSCVQRPNVNESEIEIDEFKVENLEISASNALVEGNNLMIIKEQG
ncbi:dynamin family protein [Aggregatibacter actinomycetemcomitans]|uniref:dynamin family protein n=1 Tax=Aggregatibacter actinomycetemcomitans TaxID=714 RepID=UPI00023FFA25|nr:dynamin family protein [Aggregatibacter actinomycetemcomitans]EHK89549.1 hypothetical protein RHAA1_09426 [Aggregatibacter actinomycetemcomitans RhAA1]KNE76654.1 hypothetical protein RHAA2_09670 [Aggregatibacter actinomycetemcomitans RhAA1]MBN6078920.1 dynamin family protein [Aggregatibacter actinomycetemcomitans]